METIQGLAPLSVSSTGIDKTLLEELALKTLFLNGEMSIADLAERMCLSFPVADEIFQFFRREQLCEVKGVARGTHIITASATGKQRAMGLFEFSQYEGPAPVSLADYTAQIHAQSVQHATVQPKHLNRAFEKLVLDDALLTRLGTAVVSGTSIFLYGPPGSGKTTLASNIAAIYDDFVLIPHAIEVDRQIIAVYDPGVHHEVKGPVSDEFDRRWVRCHRPRVVTGGELTVEMLDLQFNANGRYFTAPLQLKANNGVLVLDDFGRQRIRPEELLNRWMTPLDRRMDFLSLPGGKKFEVPFDMLVVFSTNIEPKKLADEAFLRRIPNKIHVTHATPEQFAEIFRRECAARMLVCDESFAEYIVDLVANQMKQFLSPSHVGDILNQIYWSASYAGVEPRLTRTALQQACHNYFLPAAEI